MCVGIALAKSRGVCAQRLDDLAAFDLAVDFKRAIYSLTKSRPAAFQDIRYRSQLWESASSVEANIAEGWRRYNPGEMKQFLRYALASLEEAKTRLKDGIHRGYFSEADCEPILTLGRVAAPPRWHS